MGYICLSSVYFLHAEGRCPLLIAENSNALYNDDFWTCDGADACFCLWYGVQEDVGEPEAGGVPGNQGRCP